MPNILVQPQSENKIGKKDIEEMAEIIFDALQAKPAQDESSPEKKSALIDSFTIVLNKLEFGDSAYDKKRKLSIISLIGKLNLQKELIDMQKGVTGTADIKETAQRFGRKAQSAFSTE